MSKAPVVKYPKARMVLTGDYGSLRYYMAQYLTWMASCGYVHSTVDGQKKMLRQFAEYCEDLGVETPQELSLLVLERYQRHLSLRKSKNGHTLSIASQIGHLGTLKQFCAWMYKHRYIDHHPALDLKKPRPVKTLPRDVLNSQDTERVLRGADVESPLGLRNRAMMEVFYSCGIRRLELVFLKVKDVMLQEGVVFIEEGKGAKDRYIPIGERALYWLKRYLKEVRPRLARAKDEGYVFLNVQGQYLSAGYLTHLMGSYVKASGLEKQGACHIFRHTMATLMLDGGADVRHVQSMLGHENLKSTQRYTHVSMHKLKEVHEKTHPGAKLKERG